MFRKQALVDDLANHFQISRSAKEVGCILVNLLKSDYAFGLTSESLQALRGKQDMVLTRMAQSEASGAVLERTPFVLTWSQ